MESIQLRGIYERMVFDPLRKSEGYDVLDPSLDSAWRAWLDRRKRNRPELIWIYGNKEVAGAYRVRALMTALTTRMNVLPESWQYDLRQPFTDDWPNDFKLADDMICATARVVAACVEIHQEFFLDSRTEYRGICDRILRNILMSEKAPLGIEEMAFRALFLFYESKGGTDRLSDATGLYMLLASKVPTSWKRKADELVRARVERERALPPRRGTGCYGMLIRAYGKAVRDSAQYRLTPDDIDLLADQVRYLMRVWPSVWQHAAHPAWFAYRELVENGHLEEAYEIARSVLTGDPHEYQHSHEIVLSLANDVFKRFGALEYAATQVIKKFETAVRIRNEKCKKDYDEECALLNALKRRT